MEIGKVVLVRVRVNTISISEEYGERYLVKPVRNDGSYADSLFIKPEDIVKETENVS